MTVLKKWLAVLFAAALATGIFPAQAAAAEAPDQLVRRISIDVLDAAKKDADIKKGDMQRILKLVDEKVMPYVDFNKTTSLAVGRHWRQATPAQREELTKQFHDLLFYTYANAISKIDAKYKLEFMPLRASADATDVVVKSKITQPKNPEPILLDYRLEKQNNNWKIYDINVMGSWLVENYKTTFSNEINRSGIDGLIKTLQDKNAALAKNQKSGAAK